MRQPAACLYPAADRRRAWPALGPLPGAGGLNRLCVLSTFIPQENHPCNDPQPYRPCRSTTSRSPSPNGASRPAGKRGGIAMA
nr:hypothetical protein [Achromobacter sp. RTa]